VARSQLLLLPPHFQQRHRQLPQRPEHACCRISLAVTGRSSMTIAKATFSIAAAAAAVWLPNERGGGSRTVSEQDEWTIWFWSPLSVWSLVCFRCLPLYAVAFRCKLTVEGEDRQFQTNTGLIRPLYQHFCSGFFPK
jgi:hypothetical protein